jgi:hypothetical protein
MKLFKKKCSFAILLVLLSVSCSKQGSTNSAASAPTSNSPRNSVDVVKVSVEPLEIKRNEDGDAVVKIEIEKGYHVNANPPTFAYLRATKLDVGSNPGTSVGFIVYPDPIIKTFPFAEKPLAVYEGITTLKVRLTANKSAQVGTQNLSGTLQVQACDDQACYAPGTLAVNIPLSIK